MGCAITRIYFPEDKHAVTSVANPRRVSSSPPASPANYVDYKIMSGGANLFTKLKYEMKHNRRLY